MQSYCRGYLTSFKSTGEQGSRFPICADTCYIGQNVCCDIRLRNFNVKDRHCLIKIIGNQVRNTDLQLIFIRLPNSRILHSSLTKFEIFQAILYSLCAEYPVLVNNNPVSADGHILDHYDKITIIESVFMWEKASNHPLVL